LIRKLYNALPGSAPLRVVIFVVIVLIVLVLLGFVFDAAGTLLDDGGTIG
jgi:hypothetical protein